MPGLDSDRVAAHAPNCDCLDCYTTAAIDLSSIWTPPPGRQATGGAASVGEVIEGHVLDVLGSLEAESVSCVVTSPPYWSLRKYDAADVVWGGGAGCEHEWAQDRSALARSDGGYSSQKRWQHTDVSREDTPEAWGGTFETGNSCSRCGAWRGQYGLEPTPELYVEHTLQVLAAIKRVLRPDGVVWWNIGDGYAAGGAKSHGGFDGSNKNPDGSPRISPQAGDRWIESSTAVSGLKPKDLVLMPFRVALAAQADGWYVRSVIIWSKPNAMPESCKDRPTTAHEYLLMLTRSPRYWYDQEAVREAAQYGYRPTSGDSIFDRVGTASNGPERTKSTTSGAQPETGRNMRSVWEFPTAQTPEAHFATFPEELPRRCIEASTPREICAKCGTARVRVVESTPMVTRPGPRAGQYGRRTTDGLTGTMLEPPSSITTSWTSCECADYQPGLVLDPFCGIGTTGVVAKRLGRRFVGIELSEKYAAMARDKLRVWWRKTNLAEPAAPEGQGVLPLEAP